MTDINFDKIMADTKAEVEQRMLVEERLKNFEGSEVDNRGKKLKDIKISDLHKIQRDHLAWRLDHKTTCGMLTASAIARGEHGDMTIVEVFNKMDKSEKSSTMNAYYVLNFNKILEKRINKLEKDGSDKFLLELSKIKLWQWKTYIQ